MVMICEGEGRSAVSQSGSEAVRRGGSWPVAGVRQRAAVEAKTVEDAECERSRALCEDGGLVVRPDERRQTPDVPGTAERLAGAVTQLLLAVQGRN